MLLSPMWHGVCDPPDWAILHVCSRRCEKRVEISTHVYDQANDPGTYSQLLAGEQRRLERWISASFEPTSRYMSEGTYQLKHVFEKASGGFYVTNGQFAAAMLAAGFVCDDRSPGRLNYKFKVKLRRSSRAA